MGVVDVAKKGGGAQTVTSNIDPQAQAYRDDVYNAARGAAGIAPRDPHADQRAALTKAMSNGSIPEWARRRFQEQLDALGPVPVATPNPQFEQQQQLYGGALSSALLGQRVLSGDQGALASMINPQLEAFLASQRQGYADAEAQGQNALADRFQRNGAYGGSRSAVAAGVLSSRVAQAQAANEAAQRYQAVEDAYGRAGNLVNFGIGAQDPRLRALLAAQGMPHGTVQSQPYNQNTVAGLLGAGLTIWQAAQGRPPVPAGRNVLPGPTYG